jgi:hypothetical protein
VNIQGTFREHSGNIQGTFREHTDLLQGAVVAAAAQHLGEYSVNIQ